MGWEVTRKEHNKDSTSNGLSATGSDVEANKLPDYQQKSRDNAAASTFTLPNGGTAVRGSVRDKYYDSDEGKWKLYSDMQPLNSGYGNPYGGYTNSNPYDGQNQYSSGLGAPNLSNAMGVAGSQFEYNGYGNGSNN